ncbi:MAG: type I restriction endonuclease subunit R [Pyrinomonadaceae bacterium]
MGHRGTETDFELTTIERLEGQGYVYVHGEEFERPHEEVVLRDRLCQFLAAEYPTLPEASLAEAVARFAAPDGADTMRRNMAFHRDVTRGIEIRIEHEDGTTEDKHIYPINWEEPEKNEFLVVNQFPIRGQNDRRPDLIIFINGLPLVVFELKNPFDEKPIVDDAINQIGHYAFEIPQLFDYNAFTVASDGIETLHGMWSADREWFAPWKSRDGVDVERNTVGTMKTLVEGLFPKDRLLSYIRDFILFEVANDKITKKAAKYHQFFAVRKAADKTDETVSNDGKDKRIGVIWHTTGSGKSLSMVFLVGILRRTKALSNPLFVVEVDRTDLDNQLFDQFVSAKALVGNVTQATSVDDLREKLKTEGGEVIFTTIEKFRMKDREIKHPVLSERSNIIVIADEAHRSQYGFDEGFARNLRDALPNARRLGFTGTPVSLSGADTTAVFGDVIHTYDIRQSQDDNATVPIFYEPRQIKLNLSKKDIDAAFDEIAEAHTVEEVEPWKAKWAALASAAGTKERVAELADDLLKHFADRTSTLKGKAMVVCMTRQNCVSVYEALTASPSCPEAKLIMTANFATDPKEWSAKGYYTTKAQREAIKKRMIDPDDKLQIVVVCDMWLTGTDIPCLHTLYIDKPMKGHNMIQAISRVNRVFRDKPHGLIVDYIGIGDELREATSKYTAVDGGEPAPDIEKKGKPIFFGNLMNVRSQLPAGVHYGDWRGLSNIELEDRFALVYGHLTEEEHLREEFLQTEHKLTTSFTLVKHLDECNQHADEVIFYQRVRKQLLKTKTTGANKTKRDIHDAVRDLVDDSIDSHGVVDIFKVAGIDRPDISILDNNFLLTFKDRPHENLRLKLLAKLLADEIIRRQKKNLAKSKSFKELLETTLQKYHNRLIDAAAVVQAMIDIHKEMEADDQRAEALGLSPEELAFYDSVAESYPEVYDDGFLRDLIHDVVLSIKRNLKVDWTEPHREAVKAEVRAAVKRVLRAQKVKPEHFDLFISKIMSQAEALYAAYPVAA